MSNYKKILIITILGFFVSVSLTLFNLKNFDRYEISTDLKEQHSMIKGDIEGHWKNAKNLKEELKEKSYFKSGKEHYQNYLPSKIILIYSYLTKDELIVEGEVTIGKKKMYLLLFQSLFFYFSIYFFSMQLSKKVNNNVFLYTAIFLSFEPTIFQWQSSFWTESIFFSLQLICFGIFIKTNKTLFNILSVGLLVGIMSLQRSAALYYIFPVLAYSLFFFKKSKLIKLFTLMSGFLIVLSFLSYHNYKRSGVFYFIPGDHKDVLQMYVYKALLAKTENLSNVEINSKIDNFFNKWVEKNQIDLNNEKDRLIFLDYKKDIVLKYIINHPIQLIEFVIEKSFHTLVLDPVHVINFHKFEYKSGTNPYYKSDTHKFWIPIRIVYSSILYAIIFIGLLYALNNKEKSLTILSLLSALYFILILCWMGNPRYFMPAMIYLSVFFGYGIDYILKSFLIKKIISYS